MARSMLQKSHQLDDSVLASGARLRARVLSLLHAALRETGCDQVSLANRLGLRKAAVNAVFNGSGNVTMNTFAEYMGVLGYEVDLVAVELGEIEIAVRERRRPNHVTLTLSDRDRDPGITHQDLVVFQPDHTPVSWWRLQSALTSPHDSQPHGDQDTDLLMVGYTRRLEASRE